MNVHGRITCVIFLICISIIAAVPAYPRIKDPAPPVISVDFADDLTCRVTVGFGPDTISIIPRGERTVATLGITGCELEGEAGEPMLPRYYLRVLVPPGSRFSALDGVRVVESRLEGTFDIESAQPQFPGYITEPPPPVGPDPAIYSLSEKWPRRPVAYVSTGIMRGYKYCTFRIAPLRYVPKKKELYLNTEISFTLRLAPGGTPPRRYRVPAPGYRRSVKERVANPQDLSFFYPPTPSPATCDLVDYLIITDDSLAPAFQDFADWKITRGLTAEVITTSTIFSTYTGVDDQEKIKECIADYAGTCGTLWVLLGGDNTVVPDRDCYAMVDEYSQWQIDTDLTIPTDLYYAALDDMDWNDDGDDLPCEPDSDGDTVDLEPDLFIGRAPVRTVADAEAFINKVMTYTDSPPQTGFLDEMLLAAVQWSQLIDGHSDADWQNQSIYDHYISPYWTGTGYRFFDTDTDFGGAGYDVTAAHLRDQLDSGYHLSLVATHGLSDAWAMESGDSFSPDDAAACVNADATGIIYTTSCLTNAFEDSYVNQYGYPGDSEPCLSEAFIRTPAGGAVAYIGASRYSWVSYTKSLGTSDNFAKYFFKDLLTGATAYPYIIGSVFNQHKLYYTGPAASQGDERWLQFAVNLMGDPQMEVRGLSGMIPESRVELLNYRWEETAGNGNGLAEPGEEIALTVVFENFGQPVGNLAVLLTTADPDAAISVNSFSAPLGFAEQTEVEFAFAVSAGFPADRDLEFDLTYGYDAVVETENLLVRAHWRVIYVDGGNLAGPWKGDASWPLQNIQDAIDQALEFYEIRVAGGAYNETLMIGAHDTVDENAGNNLRVYGGYDSTTWDRDIDANPTIICPWGSGRPVFVQYIETPTTVLSGFTLQGGSVQEGAGIYCQESSLTIMNNIITGNAADNQGGGMYCKNSDVALIGNVITDNTADASGGGIYCLNSDLTMYNNIIVDNSSSYQGGGVYGNGSSLTMTNDTIAFNSAADTAGGVYLISCETALLTNAILWENRDTAGYGQIYDLQCGTVALNYCDILGGWCGVGSNNINNDPRFIDPPGGDFHISWLSPCRGAAAETVAVFAGAGPILKLVLVRAPDDDFEGDERPAQGGYDIGADEYRLEKEIHDPPEMVEVDEEAPEIIPDIPLTIHPSVDQERYLKILVELHGYMAGAAYTIVTEHTGCIVTDTAGLAGVRDEILSSLDTGSIDTSPY